MSNTHIRNFFSFSAIHMMQLGLPLLAFSWLGRVLGPEAFGLLMYMGLIPPVICLFMEWGLTLGGARFAALLRGDAPALGTLLGDVFSAKMILGTFCILASLVLLPIVPHAPEYVCGYFLAVFLGLVRGLNPLWFYQGYGQQIRKIALWEVSSALLSLALIFFLIRVPSAWERYFLILAMCKGMVYCFLVWQLCHTFRVFVNLRRGLKIIHSTSTLFGSSFFMMIYTNGAQLLMGYFLPAQQMGVLVAIAKMIRALASLLTPVTQTIFPEICILAKMESQRPRHILTLSLLGAFGAMCMAAASISLLAPWILRVALGCDYVSNASILRIMIWASPFLGANYVLGTQVLVAFGQEKAQMSVQAIIAFFSVPFTCVCVWLWQLTGAAWVVVCLEALISAGYLWAIWLRCRQALFL